MTERVIVVGAGVIGLAVAWRAAGAGLHVTTVDEAPGRGASWAAAGMLAPVTEVHYGEEDLLRLNLAAAERYPDFVADLESASGLDPGYRACGMVAVARDADDNASLGDLFAFQRELGLKVQRLTGREVRELEPGLAPGVRGGVLVEGDHQVDSRALVVALLEACRRAGVAHKASRVVALRGPGRVELADGDILEADAVVLCAGCWSNEIAGLPRGALPPVRPVKGQLLHLRGPATPALLGRSVRGLDVYIVPRRDGRVAVGATVEELGFDARATAGGVLGLLRAAYELLPGITELELTEIAVGLRPGSPDNAPIIGPSSCDGVVVAAGHYRNGILLTPVTADAVVEILTTGSVPGLVGSFGPDRFERVGA
jgi:glycine oxidase